MPVNTNFPPLTVENYNLLPESGPRYQLIQGDLYARAGVKELWIIDPEPRIVAIHQFAFDGVDKIREVDEEEALSTDLLPGFNLAVTTIFER
jgi:Uma2 family endonuclease